MEPARVVLVTNVGQGFGRAVALAYGQSEYDVVCADRDVDLAAKTAAEIEELGGQAIPIQADMTTHMDVLGAYHKVFEIFGALGGVVHVSSQVSHTPFEDLGEAEFAELVAEDLRSAYLTLKTGARLLGAGWVVIIAPPRNRHPQMAAVAGALSSLVTSFCARYEAPRVNLVVPSRDAADPRHDAALVRSVRFLGSASALGISGQEVFVELPPPPRVTETLLPEVRAALDDRVRQDDLEASLYSEPEEEEGEEDEDEDELVLDELEQEPFDGVHARPALRHHLVDEDEGEFEADLADTPRHRLP
ncbi:MAG TPA: SDR family NAD(P)-dependent oxidoreductase [Trueperaceae bacterium]|nr:SDR family NAD(P)-dependent oxidoreductase [Trueperaceae bacterium]